MPVLWKTLLVYFQCDAAGYPALCKKVFITNEDGRPVYDENFGRFEFADVDESAKFHVLENHVLGNISKPVKLDNRDTE